jgi:ATPase subunit of ABC transporter with duplicated ATPase domains
LQISTFGKVNQYSGNYTFWYESSSQRQDNASKPIKKQRTRKKELQEFIADLVQTLQNLSSDFRVK